MAINFPSRSQLGDNLWTCASKYLSNESRFRQSILERGLDIGSMNPLFSQRSISVERRAHFIQDLSNICNRLPVSRKTFLTSVTYFDMYLIKVSNISLNDCILLLITCLILAIKVDEVDPIPTNHLLQMIEQDQFTVEQVHEFERHVVSILFQNMNDFIPCNIHSWVELLTFSTYSLFVNNDDKIKEQYNEKIPTVDVRSDASNFVSEIKSTMGSIIDSRDHVTVIQTRLDNSVPVYMDGNSSSQSNIKKVNISAILPREISTEIDRSYSISSSSTSFSSDLHSPSMQCRKLYETFTLACLDVADLVLHHPFSYSSPASITSAGIILQLCSANPQFSCLLEYAVIAIKVLVMMKIPCRITRTSIVSFKSYHQMTCELMSFIDWVSLSELHIPIMKKLNIPSVADVSQEIGIIESFKWISYLLGDLPIDSEPVMGIRVPLLKWNPPDSSSLNIQPHNPIIAELLRSVFQYEHEIAHALRLARENPTRRRRSGLAENALLVYAGRSGEACLLASSAVRVPGTVDSIVENNYRLLHQQTFKLVVTNDIIEMEFL
jgi:Cyclin, N-terminal domain